ncbi:rhomboid family intramembrane serine protease [Oceanobacillus chungangensis]|uniref:Rhomboid family intramembrane serine protease n=1 Tax=Oceanobacillus chungangensis TaxID=1229152 RepID=A0A3D8PG73_9BACI|nr:rhomboid family intramembrane serine protease [Oceanobacillus chungangensis]RDW15086.1 rhomboid family intramembrane serine protease [Oceanobacillus chungangensis]
MFIRNERSIKEFIQSYPVVSTLVIINLILWLIINFLQLPIGFMIRDWAIGYNLYIAAGEYWRLVTPIFLHGDMMHVLFNSFSLILFGPALEQMLGKFKFIFAYLGVGIIGNIATYFFEPLYYAHLGASGSIYGLFGIYVYMMIFRKDLMDSGSTQMIRAIVVIGLIMTFIRPNINIFAHLGGFIGGLLIAPLVLRNVRGYNPWQRRSYRTDDDSIQFDPNRWNKKRLLPPKIKKNLPWIIIGILALFGLLSRLF